jgi:hypothetical protein
LRKLVAVLVVAVSAVAAVPSAASTVVPGQQGRDGKVNGHYTQSIDYAGGTCNYVVNYRGDYGSDPYLDNGVIFNHIRCYGPGGNQVYNYRIVSSDQPGYRGNPDCAAYGNWEYQTLTESGTGNVCRPGGSAG